MRAWVDSCRRRDDFPVQNVLVIELVTDADSRRVMCTVDPDDGGRIVSLAVDGRELFVNTADPMMRGCYPMVPFAGRVRDARLEFDGRTHPLRPNAPPHSIHGSVLDRTWTVSGHTESSVSLTVDLGPHWPFRGFAQHHIGMRPDGLDLELSVTAHDRMPAQVGWHPCFAKPSTTRLAFDHMLVRDAAGITTGSPRAADPMTALPGNVDDCFVGVSTPDGRLRLTVSGIDISLSSDCEHWVVYDQPVDSTCVEPQSGPPNEVNDHPHILEAGGSLARFLTIEWDS